MNLQEAMKTLESMGTEQNRKIYRRHGAKEPLFGVSFANLAKLKKKIKTDHALAEGLWATRNADARTLALMVADPARLTLEQAERWVREVDHSMLNCYLPCLVARTPFGRRKMEEWTASPAEYVRECGYNLLGSFLKEGAPVSDADGRRYLVRIEKEIHGSPNRARYAMNNALIALGIYKPSLEKEAIAAAKRIGKVEVDHGETACQTPDAVAYIQKAKKRQKVNN